MGWQAACFWLLSVGLVSPCARRNGAANGGTYVTVCSGLRAA